MNTISHAIRYVVRHGKQSIVLLILFICMHQMIHTYLWMANAIDAYQSAYIESQEYWIEMDGPLLSYQNDYQSSVYSWKEFTTVVETIDQIASDPLVKTSDIAFRINTYSSTLVSPNTVENQDHPIVTYGFSSFDEISLVDGAMDLSSLKDDQAIVPKDWYIQNEDETQRPIQIGDTFTLQYDGLTMEEGLTHAMSSSLVNPSLIVIALSDAQTDSIYVDNDWIKSYANTYFQFYDMIETRMAEPLVVCIDHPLFYANDIVALQQLQNKIHIACAQLNQSQHLNSQTGYHYDSTIVQAKALTLSLQSNFRLIRVACLILFAVSTVIFYLYLNITIKQRTFEMVLLKSLGCSDKQLLKQLLLEFMVLLVPALCISISTHWCFESPLLLQYLFHNRDSISFTIATIDIVKITGISVLIIVVIVIFITIRMVFKLHAQPIHTLFSNHSK